MYSARDRVENQEWVDQIAAAVTELELSDTVRSNATDLFLTHTPPQDRSKPAVAAAALYAAALISGEERSQRAVAAAMDVTRLSIQSKWKDLLSDAGFRPPTW
ncbi:transcription initiation factor IIB family protein [Natronocalculus amylovorans]|uniref:Transcription initiation factor IIB family protein n=1 Tax=Natronocalculus amylovorans TaxID=2917812 RepID=A0AAE3FXC8_9EURY|nr:transcription initiation factor IIB family protein [Natronocalculus amylovorans]MCL9817117.1 transcription initiation factor IIB family protein [Natronocalculus amylovorans]NUE02856.1 transcription initiation factor IIB family protein [Halorubraceae archaeon YAN]